MNPETMQMVARVFGGEALGKFWIGGASPKRSIFRAESVEWATPQPLYDWLNDRFGPFDLDPAATAENAKTPRFFTEAEDGLTQDWSGAVYLNPPYGRGIDRWVDKAWASSMSTGTRVVALLPVRTDTEWWQTAVMRGARDVYLIRGRVSFGRGKKAVNAPFASCVVVWRGNTGGLAPTFHNLILPKGVRCANV